MFGFGKKLSDRQKAYYEPILKDLAKRLEGFTHKEQKAFWYVKDGLSAE